MGVAGAVAAVVFALATTPVRGPFVFLDELIYMDAATSVADGNGLSFRDGDYGYGPVYPVAVSGVLRIVDDRVLAYHVVLALTGLLLGSAAVPVFLLARKIARPRMAVAAALACLLLPSSFYAAYLMTDGPAYVCALWVILAIVRVVEAPSRWRQLMALASCGFAIAVRPQLAVLVPALLASILLHGRMRGLSLARIVRSHDVVAGASFLGAVGVAVMAASGRGSDLLGSYAVLWSTYDLLAAARWTAYHVFDAALYMWVLPAVLLPCALAALWRRGRNDSAAAAMCAVVMSVTVGFLVLDGLFGATQWSGGRLHDRYLIVIFPLWTLVMVDWVDRGALRPRGPLTAGVAVVVLTALLTPFRGVIDVETPNLFDAVATTWWSLIGDLVGTEGLLSARGLMLAYVAAAVVVASFGNLRGVKVGLALSIGLIAMTSATQWLGAITTSDRETFADRRRPTLLWVDKAAGERRVTTLVVGSEACNRELFLRANLETEFFNRSIGPRVLVGAPYGPSDGTHVLADGTVLDERGAPASAALVLAPPGLALQGEPIATGTTAGMRLWRVDGPIRVAGRAALDSACPHAG